MAAKKKKEIKKETSSLDVAKKAIEKKFGNIIKPMSFKPDKIEVISSGSIGLDSILGVNGIALGRIHEIYGPTGGGKTTLTINLIAQAQKKGYRCLFIDAERTSDKNLFRSMGVDTNKLDLVEVYNGEEAIDIIETLIGTNEIDLVVLDSVSSLIPKAETEQDMEQQFMGLHARLMSKALRKLVPLSGSTNTAIVFINQVRVDLGKWGNNETTSGGLALPFYATTRLRVSGSEKKANRIIDPENGNVIGHRMEVEIMKNKLASPFRKCSIDLYYGQGYDTINEILQYSVDLALLEKAGAWYKKEGQNFAQGEIKAKQYLEENVDFYKELRKGVIDMLCMGDDYK